jgi:hypothetical protein
MVKVATADIRPSSGAKEYFNRPTSSAGPVYGANALYRELIISFFKKKYFNQPHL